MKFLILAIVTFVISGCETINGVGSHFDEPVRLNDPQCIDRAVKNTPQAEYIDSKVVTENSKTIGGKPVETRDYNVTYKIPKLKSSYTGMVQLSEQRSEDPSPSYNKYSLGNIYGHTNGPSYSKAELSTIRDVIESMNKIIKKSCGLASGFKIK